MITILKPGFFTSIQDNGRYGFRSFGVPISGCMDRYSAAIANAVLGNNTTNALLEITLGNIQLCFDIQTVICVSGGDFNAKLNNSSIALNRAINIHEGDVLTFTYPEKGAIVYVAVAGGIRSEKVMNSRSYQCEITPQLKIVKGMKVAIRSLDELEVKLGDLAEFSQEHFSAAGLVAEPGPEFETLHVKEQSAIFNNQFTLSNDCNRVGFRLNERIRYEKPKPMLTAGVMPGTVQLTPSGALIILMRDCQVTGGYPRVLQLTEESISRLAQKRPGDVVWFKKQNLNS